MMKKIIFTLATLSLGLLSTASAQNNNGMQNATNKHFVKNEQAAKLMTTKSRLLAHSRWEVGSILSGQVVYYDIDTTQLFWTGNNGSGDPTLEQIRKTYTPYPRTQEEIIAPYIYAPFVFHPNYDSAITYVNMYGPQLDTFTPLSRRGGVLHELDANQRVKHRKEGAQSYGYEYSSNGEMAKMIYYNANNEVTQQKEWTFNNNGQPLEMLEKRPIGNNLINFLKGTSTYNAQGEMTQILVEEWDTATSSWNISPRTLHYAYDNSGNLVARHFGISSQDTNNLRHIFKYGANNHLTQIIEIAAPDSQRVQDTTLVYTALFDASGNLLEWTLQVRSSMDYNEPNLLNRAHYTYDYTNGKVSQVKYYDFYDTLSQSWELERTVDFTYNTYDQIITAIHTEPNPSGPFLEKHTFYYEEYEDNGNSGSGINQPITEVEFTLYPNPAKTEINVRMNDASVDGITVYDMTGKQVYIKYNNLKQQEMTVPVNHLAPGVYVMRIQSGNQTGTKQFVVRH